MPAHTLQRIGAYIIDYLIVFLFLLLLTFWIPTSKEYENAYKKENEFIEKITDLKKFNKDTVDEYIEIKYTLGKENITYSLISNIILLGYFATFAYYNNGQTIGKKIMKIKVVSNDDEEVSHISFLGRTLIIHSVLTSIISIIFLLFIKKEMYISTVGMLSLIQSIIFLLSIFLIILRKDKRGVHDFLFKTKVIQE